MKTREIMTENVIACSPDTSIEDVARILVENGFSGVPGVENNKEVLFFFFYFVF